MTRHWMKKASLACAALLLMAPPAAAGGVPTFDGANLTQNLLEFQQMIKDYGEQVKQLKALTDQVKTAKEQLTNMKEQLDTAKDQVAALTGGRGVSGILNGEGDVLQRQAADSLGGILDGALNGSGIKGNTGRMEGRMTELQKLFEPKVLTTFSTSDVPQQKAIAGQAAGAMAAIATSEDAYARSNEAMGRVNTLIGQIDSNADLKASVDFNSRMLAELAILLAENLRLQAAMANSEGASNLAAARDAAAANAFMNASVD